MNRKKEILWLRAKVTDQEQSIRLLLSRPTHTASVDRLMQDLEKREKQADLDGMTVREREAYDKIASEGIDVDGLPAWSATSRRRTHAEAMDIINKIRDYVPDCPSDVG